MRTPGARYCFCTQRIIFTKIMRSMQGQYSRVQMTSLGVGTRKNRCYWHRHLVGISNERLLTVRPTIKLCQNLEFVWKLPQTRKTLLRQYCMVGSGRILYREGEA
jgi:hypothetical protein